MSHYVPFFGLEHYRALFFFNKIYSDSRGKGRKLPILYSWERITTWFLNTTFLMIGNSSNPQEVVIYDFPTYHLSFKE